MKAISICYTDDDGVSKNAIVPLSSIACILLDDHRITLTNGGGIPDVSKEDIKKVTDALEVI